jgi:hypothetical protein
MDGFEPAVAQHGPDQCLPEPAHLAGPLDCQCQRRETFAGIDDSRVRNFALFHRSPFVEMPRSIAAVGDEI